MFATRNLSKRETLSFHSNNIHGQTSSAYISSSAVERAESLAVITHPQVVKGVMLSMSHSVQFLGKFLINSLLLYLVLSFLEGVSTTTVLLLSIILTAIGYLLDIYLLPRIGNLFSVLTDLLLVFTVVWLAGTYWFDTDIGTQNYKLNAVPLFGISLLAAVVLSAAEWFYHRWLLKAMYKTDPQESG
jgi:uncharacterized membrane protein YvlD (DUF360 family)